MKLNLTELPLMWPCKVCAVCQRVWWVWEGFRDPTKCPECGGSLHRDYRNINPEPKPKAPTE